MQITGGIIHFLPSSHGSWDTSVVHRQGDPTHAVPDALVADSSSRVPSNLLPPNGLVDTREPREQQVPDSHSGHHQALRERSNHLCLKGKGSFSQPGATSTLTPTTASSSHLPPASVQMLMRANAANSSLKFQRQIMVVFFPDIRDLHTMAAAQFLKSLLDSPGRNALQTRQVHLCIESSCSLQSRWLGCLRAGAGISRGRRASVGAARRLRSSGWRWIRASSSLSRRGAELLGRGTWQCPALCGCAHGTEKGVTSWRTEMGPQGAVPAAPHLHRALPSQGCWYTLPVVVPSFTHSPILAGLPLCA